MALATRWNDIIGAAERYGAGLYFEASVCGAIPIIRAMSDSLQANRIEAVMGIINGSRFWRASRFTGMCLWRASIARASRP